MIEYYYIATIALLGAISPGPDFVVVVKNALAHDRRMAIMASLGVSVGVLFHSSYCVLGLGLVITNSIVAFNIIKYLGACYLIYLGTKSLMTQQFARKIEPGATAPYAVGITLWQAFRDGFFTNVLNPKCTLFILSVFTMAVNPNTPKLVQALYGIEIAIITAAWFIFLSYGFTHNAIRAKINKAQKAVGKIIGIVLVSLGIMVLLESH